MLDGGGNAFLRLVGSLSSFSFKASSGATRRIIFCVRRKSDYPCFGLAGAGGRPATDKISGRFGIPGTAVARNHPITRAQGFQAHFAFCMRGAPTHALHINSPGEHTPPFARSPGLHSAFS
jgi:hypothetical protein